MMSTTVAIVPRLPAMPPLFPSGKRPPRPHPATPTVDPYLVDCGVYVDGHRVPGATGPAEALDLARARGGFVWLGLLEPDADDMAGVAELFTLHELAVEDAVVAHQRPKLERYKRNTLLVLKTVRYVEHDSPTTADEIVETGEIEVFLGENFILTVRHGHHSELAGLRKALEADPEQLALGPAAVMHAIADRVVDQYLKVVESVEDDIDELETLIFDPRSQVSIGQIYLFKREVLELRRAVAPLRAPLRDLTNNPNPLVPHAVQEYFRDVEDHLTHVADQVATFDELLTTLINAALAEVTTQQNEDMRKISAWAAIALVPTAIAGIYGMNFHNMPELSWRFGYPMAIGLILLICILLYRVLRKRGWL
jgi:magnesium transporter